MNKVVENTLGSALDNASVDPGFCSVKDANCRQVIPAEHLAKVLHQVTVIISILTMYVVFSEMGVLCTVVLQIRRPVREIAIRTINTVASPAVSWAHNLTGTLPPFGNQHERDLLCSRWSFWSVVNEHVYEMFHSVH